MTAKQLLTKPGWLDSALLHQGNAGPQTDSCLRRRGHPRHRVHTAA